MIAWRMHPSCSMQHLRNPESMVETMRFSSRVDISEPNSIAKAEAEAKTNGITLGKLNDSNPTKHALAPEFLPDIYGAVCARSAGRIPSRARQ
jgi:hypothetical protein